MISRYSRTIANNVSKRTNDARRYNMCMQISPYSHNGRMRRLTLQRAFTSTSNNFHLSERNGRNGSGNKLFSALPQQAPVDDTQPLDESLIEQSLDIPIIKVQKDCNGEEISDLPVNLKSKPVPGGNWQPETPLAWTKTFGRRSDEETARLHKLAKLKPGDEGYFDISSIDDAPGLEQVTIVRTKEQAEIVLKKLMSAPKDTFHACDTEVMEIDLRNVGPVGNGFVTCLSVYSGPEFDYGLGDGPGTSLWIDNLDDSFGLLDMFKSWLEDEEHLKVWHNYGFDRHVLWNEGIDCRGFGGDTMHMARLRNTARLMHPNPMFRGYSLEALSADLLNQRKKPMKEIFGVPRIRKDGSEGSIVDIPPVEVLQRDPKHRVPWIRYSAYDAKSTWQIRDILAKLLEKMPWFINESGEKHFLYEFYMRYLRPFGEVLTDMERRGVRVDAKGYLANVEIQAREDRARHLDVFRKWAETQIGPDGLAINVASTVQLSTFLFGGSTNAKTKLKTEESNVFKIPREEVPEEALLAYAKRDEERKKKLMESAGGVGTNADENYGLEEPIDAMKVDQLKTWCKHFGLKVSGKKSDLKERLRGYCLSNASNDDSVNITDDYSAMSVEDLRDSCATRGLSDEGTKKALEKRLREEDEYSYALLSSATPRDQDGYRKVSEMMLKLGKKDQELSEMLDEIEEKMNAESKYVDVKISSIGLTPTKFTAGGAPSCTADVLRKLAGEPFEDPPRYGTAYEAFKGGEAGHNACVALYSLTQIGSIDTMISNFLTSLQTLADEQSRVHCSLNINTETGRLSSRSPNLQNQPALEKDKYKIRQAFEASPGNSLIVADYGQLELRLLASMTSCQSMIEAFESGGDFHSRTALGMFDYIQKDIEAGEVLLEWDYANGDPPKPMLKDKYASERRKAKTLNFSIAYGKTAHGLSQDWGVSVPEAEEMLQAWYNSRPEVRSWQKKVKSYAKKKLITRTLMGRYRHLPGAKGNRKEVGRAERASINTPIQGGAADVAMMAMIKINRSEVLKQLGWILLMQIHDEMMLEGPEETAEEAFAEVIKCMEAPWDYGLDKTKVPLLVDGSYVHKNWYDAK
eukprot:CAMPEP_0178949760 /NCGR_PEP_ID=MMETSP0789-20121207/6247_1 /TAXON_ID=3005 /ORGANISM="Rhizosolenia setigera, Strain CCMP 1694" /LENGTH=1085 /DNA_ID=CAMNT_0020630353 /DNA_START=111 /DNA_END=3371 /DNA_ORIENTATION=+